MRRDVLTALNRPYPVTWEMLLLVALIPGYLLIAGSVRGRPLHAPALALDGRIPVVPAWALVYGALYLFLIFLPFFVIRGEDLVRRTIRAYLLVWLTAFAIFLAYPTVAPRPGEMSGSGFAAWGLRFLYGADPPLNCFPSIHVAHSFVSAIACGRVHRRLGVIALGCASLVALSTLFTRQHYVLDLVAGVLLAAWACWIFLSGHPRGGVPDLDRRLAPALALCAGGVVILVFLGFWLAYVAGARA